MNSKMNRRDFVATAAAAGRATLLPGPAAAALFVEGPLDGRPQA